MIPRRLQARSKCDKITLSEAIDSMAEANIKHKDRLFRFIFGNEENRAWTLSLYNAVNGSHYDDPSQIQITTIGDVIYMGMKNDVSFMIADTVNIYEQQSTFNPNIPTWSMICAGMAYSNYVKTHRVNVYSSRQQTLPVPKLVCFYNGTREQPDRRVLSLRDAFDRPEESDIEVRVTMLNINHGHNEALMNACQPLKEYAQFIYLVREYQGDGDDLERALDKAIDAMPEGAGIKPFLLAHKADAHFTWRGLSELSEMAC